jgi:methylated-DNA-[protein]-cysteine S-methyltransferase
VLSKNRFNERVWRLCARIPRGRVSTYGDLARALGSPGASRAVGQALNKSPGMPHVPCHRVVSSDGSLGGFAWGPKEKARLLEREGVRVTDGRVADFARVRYRSKARAARRVRYRFSAAVRA